MAYDNPHGFYPVKYDPRSVKWFDVSTDSTDITAAVDNIYIGDLVVNSSNAAGYVVAADNGIAADAEFVGVAVGVADGSSSDTNFHKVPVIIDPTAIFRCQSDDSSTPTQSQLFTAFNTYVPATYTGNGTVSDMELDGSSSHTDGQWILVGIVSGPQPGGGALPAWEAANMELYVKYNPTQMDSWAI